jgi:hypothetical protein
MSKRISETHYSLRTTFFRNNYEDPGDEFEIDPEDPVGLVSSRRRMDLQDEIHGDPVPGFTDESSTVRVTESEFRQAARYAASLEDAQLISETIVLREFIGGVVKKLRRAWNRGIFKTLGSGIATVIKKSLGTQKDLDREYSLKAEKQFLRNAEVNDGDLVIDFDSPETIREITKALIEYYKEMAEVTNDDDSVFPKYGNVHSMPGEKDKRGEELKTGEEERLRYATEIHRANVHIRKMVISGAKVRGILLAIQKAKGEDLGIGDATVDATYPLSYVISNGIAIKRVMAAISDDIEGKNPKDVNDLKVFTRKVEQATAEFVKRFKPELVRLQRKMFEAAAVQLIANRAVLQERKGHENIRGDK